MNNTFKILLHQIQKQGKITSQSSEFWIRVLDTTLSTPNISKPKRLITLTSTSPNLRFTWLQLTTASYFPHRNSRKRKKERKKKKVRVGGIVHSTERKCVRQWLSLCDYHVMIDWCTVSYILETISVLWALSAGTCIDRDDDPFYSVGNCISRN